MNQTTVLEWATAIAAIVGSIATVVAVGVALLTAVLARRDGKATHELNLQLQKDALEQAKLHQKEQLALQENALRTDEKVRADAHAQRVARELGFDTGLGITTENQGGSDDFHYRVFWSFRNLSRIRITDIAVFLAQPWRPEGAETSTDAVIQIETKLIELAANDQYDDEAIWYRPYDASGRDEPPLIAIRFVDDQGNGWLYRSDNALFMDAARFIGAAPEPFVAPAAPELLNDPQAWWITANRTDRSINLPTKAPTSP